MGSNDQSNQIKKDKHNNQNNRFSHTNPAIETHQVFNQPTALENYNAYTSDQVLNHYIEKFGGAWGQERLSDYGHQVGNQLLTAGFSANQFKPEFETHDRFGHRIDQVNFHPAYHQLMDSAIRAGHHSLPWTTPDLGSHVIRAGIAYLHTQADPGSGCPLTMTFSAVPAIKHQPDIAKVWLPKITANHYDPQNRPFHEKQGVTIGMAMTEKQGGSDVRANTTKALPIDLRGGGKSYLLTGHKWFCSAPMCDAFLVLAQAEGGLSCFLLPRWRPDGTKNSMFIQRLKNKMGNISNASSEVEFREAFAWLIGEEGRGVKTILEMVSLTRFDCMLGSSAIMRLAVAQAIHHTGGREVFGQNLQQQPLMKNVLADLALESEAALAISLRLAKALDNQAQESERLLLRIGTAIGKYWICKRAPQHTYEAMESIGGVGVVEDNVLARLYRESPVNAIWEGSGNIQCLDVARAIIKEPKVTANFINELEQAQAKFKAYDDSLGQLKNALAQNKIAETDLRYWVEKMALLWQASVLINYSPAFVAEAFINGRLGSRPSQMYGALQSNTAFEQLIERAAPKLTS
ncbi:acyl-CoA dehydrogenase family protein [Aliikangiella sp. IMCC44632]